MQDEKRILIVDDDESIVDVLTMALEDAGFAVVSARDGAEGWAKFQLESPDLVLLDLLMPEIDGLELCRRIRGASRTLVVMLTSRAEEMDQVLGLHMGADDYITKPFSTRILLAHVRALLRRVELERPSEDRSEVDGLVLDRKRREVSASGRRIELTVTEFDLLFALVERRGEVLSRDALIDAVYGENIVVSDRTIDTFVKRLRRKLSEATPGFDRLETVRGVGYRYRE